MRLTNARMTVRNRPHAPNTRPLRDAGWLFDGLARRVIQCACALGHLTHMRRMNIPYMLGDMAQAFLPGDRKSPDYEMKRI